MKSKQRRQPANHKTTQRGPSKCQMVKHLQFLKIQNLPPIIMEVETDPIVKEPSLRGSQDQLWDEKTHMFQLTKKLRSQ